MSAKISHAKVVPLHGPLTLLTLSVEKSQYINPIGAGGHNACDHTFFRRLFPEVKDNASNFFRLHRFNIQNTQKFAINFDYE